MRIFHQYKNFPIELQQAAVVVGNFDGVHLGHKALIQKAKNIAATHNCACVALTFEPHPKSIFSLQKEYFRLTPLRAKACELEQVGINATVVIRFDAIFAKQTANSFVCDILVNGLNARHIIVGDDFRFGHNREGSCDLLYKMGKKYEFGFTAVSPVKNKDKKVYSSSKVREFIQKGNLKDAKDFLGHDFAIYGRVAHGEKLGRKLGFPTANIHLKKILRPKLGVYAVSIRFLESQTIELAEGVASIGTRPTVKGQGELLEVFIFNFKKNIYRQHVKISLIEFIRPELKFENLPDMVREMKLDVEAAKKIFLNNKTVITGNLE